MKGPTRLRGALAAVLWLGAGLLVGRLSILYVLDRVLRDQPLDVTLWRMAHDLYVPLLHALGAAAAAVALLSSAARSRRRRALLVVLAAALFASALSGWPFDEPSYVPGLGTRRGRLALSAMGLAGLAAAGAARLLLRAPRRAWLASPATLAGGAALALVAPLALALRYGAAPPVRHVREIVREIAFEPDTWQVVGGRQNPRQPPGHGVLCPSLDYRVDGGDLPALVMPPPCSVEFAVGQEDGDVYLRAAAGVDYRVLKRMKKDQRLTVRFEVLVGGQRVFAHDQTLYGTLPQKERAWAHVGGERGLALAPGARVELRTSIVEPAYAEGDPVPVIAAGFGRTVLERELAKSRLPSSPDAPSIVLIVMDTLRRDRLACYGYGVPISPNLDRLAARGTIFDAAYSTASWTWPATASILTGLPPETHGVLEDGACHLSSSIASLPKALERRSYTTGAITCNPLIVPDKNFDQGFEYFNSVHTFRKSHLVIGAALEWIEMHADSRFFLYLHLVDPHAPYEGIAAAADLIPGTAPADYPETGVDEYHARFVRGEGHDAQGRSLADEIVPRAQREWMNTSYDRAVYSADYYVGEVLAQLERLGLTDKTVVAFTSDHGEEFFEHGMLTHGISLYRELTQVPLLLAGPGIPSGVRVSERVSNRHIAPTLAKFGNARIEGLPDPLDLSRVNDIEERPIFFSTHQGFWNGVKRLTIYGVIDGDWELHWCREGAPWGERWKPGGEGQVRLFHLPDDPGQLRDVAVLEPQVVARLKEELIAHLQEAARLKPKLTVGVGARAANELQKIGYTDGPGDGEDDDAGDGGEDPEEGGGSGDGHGADGGL